MIDNSSLLRRGHCLYAIHNSPFLFSFAILYRMEPMVRPQNSSSIHSPTAESSKVANKTFYRFVFSFVAVIAVTLLLILALGVSSGVQ